MPLPAPSPETRVYQLRVTLREITPPIWPDATMPREQAIQQLTQAVTDRLADAIRRHPAEYFWAHRRWKTQPPGSA